MKNKAQVWQATEEFRNRNLHGKLSYLPIDVVSLVELELRLDLIPFDDLHARFQCDAALMADFSGIYVDAEAYLLIDDQRAWKLNRLRFSIAHELGHFVMHQEYFMEHGFNDANKFISWTHDYGGQKYTLEQQANEFAGRLLVPHDALQKKYEEIEDHFTNSFPDDWRQDSHIRQKAAERIAPIFGVHSQTIETRFSREEIWPDPTK